VKLFDYLDDQTEDTQMFVWFMLLFMVIASLIAVGVTTFQVIKLVHA